MTQLSQKQCVPCQGGEEPLDDETSEILLGEVDEAWGLNEEKRLVREVTGENFVEIVALVNDIADVAEEEGHHPNLCIHDYKQLTIELYTHKIDGLHENDFILAAKIDELLE